MTQLLSPSQRPNMNSQDVAKWVVVGIMVFVGLVGLIMARQLIAPVDNFVTGQACADHGSELSRPAIEHERSNRFGLRNRSHGWCLFGPVVLEEEDADGAAADDGAAASGGTDGETTEVEAPIAGFGADPAVQIQLTIDEIQPGSLYRIMKFMAVVLQLGIASIAVRVVGDPLLDRFVRSKR